MVKLKRELLWVKHVNTNVFFVVNTPNVYVSVDIGLFKDSSLINIFPLPPSDANVSPINMISLFTSGSLGSYDAIVPKNLADLNCEVFDNL